MARKAEQEMNVAASSIHAKRKLVVPNQATSEICSLVGRLTAALKHEPYIADRH